MSFREGKDNLAYRNYKMSEEFKKRVLDDYKEMLNNPDELKKFDEKIVNIDAYRKRRDDSLPIEKQVHKKIDLFIKMGVASFAIITSLGILKTGVNNISNNKVTAKVVNDDKFLAGGERLEGIDGNDEVEFVGDYDESKFPELYPECYDKDGNLKTDEGYEIRILKDKLMGSNKVKKVVGRDFVEISREEYEQNDKEGNGVASFNHEQGSFVYYLQGNKFCRTDCNEFFNTERYSFTEIDQLKKKDKKVYIYPKNPGKYENQIDNNIPDEEYFYDCNMIPIMNLTIDVGGEVQVLYVKDVVNQFDNSNIDEYSSSNIYLIDDEDSLWALKDVDYSDLGSKFLNDKGCTYILKDGKNFKTEKLAEHVCVDEDIDYNASYYDSSKIYIKSIDGFNDTNVLMSDEKILYRGKDYK